MARLLNNTTGTISGKLGNLVGATWRGIPYLRSRPARRTGRISEKEKNNRDKFAAAQYWLKPLLEFVRVGFKNYSPTVVGFNAAKSWLMKNAMEQTEEGIIIHPSRMLLSFGDLPLASNLRVGEIKDGQLPVYWDVIENDYYHMHDQCMLLAYDIKNAVVTMNLTGQFRHTGTGSLFMYPMKQRTYHIYAAFIAADRSRVSNSVYLGEVET